MVCKLALSLTPSPIYFSHSVFQFRGAEPHLVWSTLKIGGFFFTFLIKEMKESGLCWSSNNAGLLLVAPSMGFFSSSAQQVGLQQALPPAGNAAEKRFSSWACQSTQAVQSVVANLRALCSNSGLSLHGFMATRREPRLEYSEGELGPIFSSMMLVYQVRPSQHLFFL